MSGKLLARLYPAHRAFHRASLMGTRKAGVSTFPDFAGHDSRVPIVVPLMGRFGSWTTLARFHSNRHVSQSASQICTSAETPGSICSKSELSRHLNRAVLLREGVV